MSVTSRTTRPAPASQLPDRVADRQTMLRAVAGSIYGRGRVLGPVGGWVSVDFDDIREHIARAG